jgi:serine/threonine protein kinase
MPDEPSGDDDRELLLMDRYWKDLRLGAGTDPRSWLEDSECDTPKFIGRLQVLRLMHELRLDLRKGGDRLEPEERPGSNQGFLPDGTRLEGGELCITGLLDAGGMGEVYQAWHETMGCLLAVKLTRDPALQARFRREIEIQRRLGGHPHIVLARTAGQHDGRHYLVMDYIPGVNLRQIVETHGPMPWREATRVIRQAALGLDHAHTHNVVHRDIKPGNLIRSAEDQTVKILDWGLARYTSGALPRDAQDLTQSGCQLGTPLYAAPEQLANPAAAGPASDLYSLGCTFYFLLTGRPPFADPRDRRRGPFPLPQELGVPVGVDQIIRTLLRPEPADRFRSAREVIEAIDDVLTPMPAKAPVKHPPGSGLGWLWPRPRSLFSWASSSSSDIRMEVYSNSGLMVGTR